MRGSVINRSPGIFVGNIERELIRLKIHCKIRSNLSSPFPLHHDASSIPFLKFWRISISEDLKKKINFDPSLLYYSPTSKENEEDEKPPVTNVETYNSTNRKHICTVCGKRFFTVSALNVHIEHHPPNERSNIEKDDDNANTNRKNQYVWNNGIKCSKFECNFIALDAVEYSKHISTCEGIRLTKNADNSFCEFCNSYFSSENHYKAHLILQHPDCAPDISLKEYDAKYTTISDPVSLYVSENNSEIDADIKLSKNISHLKYPDSSITKRKSKEAGTEEISQLNQNTDKIMEQVTSIVESTPTVTNSEKIQEVKQDLTSTVGKSPMENSDSANVSKTANINNLPDLMENGKCDENEKTEHSAIQLNDVIDEKSPVEKLEESPSKENNVIADPSTNYDNLEQNNSQNISIEDERIEISHDAPPKSVEVKNDLTEKLPDGEPSDNAKVQQTVDEDEKLQRNSVEADSKNDKQTDDTTKHENYVNVEKMMYNLFKDEGTTETSLQERGDVQDLNDVSPEKNKEENELSQTNNVTDADKEDSDFEEFDYNRAGKKKYLKSYSRLNKNKTDLNKEEKVDETPVTKEEVDGTELAALDSEEPKQKKTVGRKSKKSLIVETPATDLNIKERSTRTRKKLILPDFEYDSDYKSYTPEVSKRIEVPKRPSLPKNNDTSPRKRGRPRKNPDAHLDSSANDSAIVTDISTNSANKSTTNVNDRIENSYLNAVETPKTRDIADIKIPNSDSANTSNSMVSDSFTQKETPKNTSAVTDPIKKKRGRPPKIKSESEATNERPETPATSSMVDTTTEESICSDVANALLSLSDSVRTKESVAHKSTLTPVSTKKNDLVADQADDSKEIDTDLSLNDTSKFDKNKDAEAKSNGFMKDTSSVAGVSAPRKRGRPPKLHKRPKSLSIPPKQPVPKVPLKPKLNKSLPTTTDEQKKVDKLFDAKLSDRKSVFLKNKAKINNVLKDDLKPNVPVKKKGRPSLKSLQDTFGFTPRPIHDIAIDESDVPETTVKPASKVNLPKKKKGKLGRPRKSDTTSDTSLQKNNDTPKTMENNLNSHKDREESPFIYESYHPKKKRARLDIDEQKDSEKDASVSKTEEKVAPQKAPRILKPKKPPPPPPVEIPDETRDIDEELYMEDVKNRTKYGKLFKKPKSFVYDEKYTDDMMINCGRCKKKMTFRHYKNYHQVSHYYLSWIEGDQEIDLNDDSDVVRILQSSITPDALKKKAIRLACEKCGDVRKSVVGYVSHVRFCQKEDKNSLFETCKLCGRALRPSSVRFHYIKFHGYYKPTKGGMCFSNENDALLNSLELDDSDDPDTPARKRIRMGFTRRELPKKDVIADEEFWTELKTSCDLYMCMGLSCRHMAISKEDLKSHVSNCVSIFCEFSCSSCDYKTKYENEIIYHSKKQCLSNVNEEIITSTTESGRRVSTRQKFHNFKYDQNNSDDETSNRDADFDVGAVEDKSDDEDDYNSDLESEKPSIRKAIPSLTPRKKSDRVLTSTSITDKLGLRNAFQQYCSGRTDPLRWTVDLRLKLFSSTPLHVHMKVNTKEWELLSSTETEKYIPIHTKSVKAYFHNGGSSSQFDLFQADVIKGVPLCYVGGPVWAMAWAPIPAHVTEQYLAVSTLRHMNHLIGTNESVSFPSLIQFWKFSSIDNISNDIQKPVLGWSIAHSYGAVWSMEWCPSGGFNNLSTTTRLGILAAATSSGCVIVYNVPKLEISDKEPKDTVTNPKPDLILKVRYDNVQCTRIVWDQISPHNSLIGGFSNGSVAFWNINTASVLLKKGNVVYPYRIFEAHNSAITALDLHWLNNSKYLLTGSINRVTRHWDLNDLSGPIHECERPTPVLDAVWMQHWIVTANVHDFGNLVGESGSFIAHPRDPFEKKKTLMNIRDTFWSLSYSLWNDTVAVSSNGGFVSVYAAKHLAMLTYKSPDFEKILTSTELVKLSDADKKDFSSDELVASMPSTNDLYDCTTAIKNNGIQFIDKAKNDMNSETLSFDLKNSNITSVNKVCWNQNYNSFNWLAIGYECGFVRVIRVERFDKHYLTKFYKTNENTATLM
ncbi:uncharacterized protein LOC135840117 isoform X2 [Planococcus citri]|uniref:uncharacterized protein LOC135840117 isoform X2 n=1 Tax=Planococcus citri TaxID=170843 RepID=UPI0031F7AADC